MANDLTLTPAPAAVPGVMSVAPSAKTTATVQQFAGAPTQTPTYSIVWGQITGDILQQIDLQQTLALKAGTAQLNAHIADKTNPHAVTKAQVGLDQVDNISSANMPVSSPQATAIAAAVTGPLPGASITAEQISNSTLPGRNVLKAATAAAQRTALGSGAIGDVLFQATTAASGRGTLGAGVGGDPIFTAATTQAVRDIMIVAPEPTFKGRINLVSSSILRLSRYGGSWIFINGQFRQIPSGGVDLAPTGLTVGVMYNIYAYWTGSAIALEANTTARATDTTYGHPIKSGDPTRSYLGKSYVNTGPVWDTTNLLLSAINYYNRLRRNLSTQYPTTQGPNSNTSPSPYQPPMYFGSDGENTTEVAFTAVIQGNTAGNVVFGRSTVRDSLATTIVLASTSGYFQPYSGGAYGTINAKVEGVFADNLGTQASGSAYQTATLDLWTNGGNYAAIGGVEGIASIMG